jgi:hypothetical protein
MLITILTVRSSIIPLGKENVSHVMLCNKTNQNLRNIVVLNNCKHMKCLRCSDLLQVVTFWGDLQALSL